MDEIDKEFLAELMAAFREEADERLHAINHELLAVERTLGSAQAPEHLLAAFKAMHSLKGAARAVALVEVEQRCEQVEGTLARIVSGDEALTRPTLDALFKAVDAVNGLLAEPEGELSFVEAVMGGELSELEGAPTLLATEPAPLPSFVAGPVEARAVPAAPVSGDTVRIGVVKLEALMQEVEELLGAKLAAEHHSAELRSLSGWFDTWRRRWTETRRAARAARSTEADGEGARVGGAPSQAQAELLEFMTWSAARTRELERQVGALTRSAEANRRALSRIVDGLLTGARQTLMTPMSTVVQALPRMVRDVAQAQGKEVELVILGGEIELDRRIIEELKDPLTHLIRNSLDHGIETPRERVARGKPARGTLTINVVPAGGGRVELHISDDGAGIDPEAVKAVAVARGFVTAAVAATMTDAEALRLTFRSALSTRAEATGLSGRGLGLSIVEDRVERLGGEVWIESKPGDGTAFVLSMPQTRSTARGILAVCAERTFVVPTASIDRILRVRRADITGVEGAPVVDIDGRLVSFVWLAVILELPAKAESGELEWVQVLVATVGGRSVAFGVDAILGEQEVLIKPLGPQLARVRNVSGASILGSGQIAPVLNVADLVHSAVGRHFEPARGVATVETERGARTILVAEDSVTSRMLLRSVLERAGYVVRTAVDGVDALSALRCERFDAVVSDVEMPRMTGFELTSSIRRDAALAHLPVILVTALASERDRLFGLEVGATAYIVKSRFDDRGLLSVLEQYV